MAWNGCQAGHLGTVAAAQQTTGFDRLRVHQRWKRYRDVEAKRWTGLRLLWLQDLRVTVDVHTTDDATWRIHVYDNCSPRCPRTIGKPVPRFKVRRPEPPRRPVEPNYLPVRQSTATRNS